MALDVAGTVGSFEGQQPSLVINGYDTCIVIVCECIKLSFTLRFEICLGKQLVKLLGIG